MKSLSQGPLVSDADEIIEVTPPGSADDVTSGTPRRNPRRPTGKTYRRLGLLAGLFLLIGGGIAVVRERRAVERDARAARAAMTSSRFGLAREPLGRWLRARPRSAEAHALAAELALAEGRLKEIKPDFEQARSLGCPEPQLERLRALWSARAGQYSEALPILERLWTETPVPDAAVDEALARIYLKTYRLARARAVIRRWIEDAPTDGRPFLWLTEIDRRTDIDNPESWVGHYREALKRDPDLDAARRGLAESLRRVHRNDEAAREYESYLARNPDDPEALTGAGLNAMELGDLAAATRLLDRALALTPTSSAALKGKAEVDLQRGEIRSAARRLDRAIQADPFDEQAFQMRMQVRNLLGDAAGARSDRATFDRLKKDQAELLELRGRLLNRPDDHDARSKVAAWMLAHGREQDGLDWAMAILAKNPDHAPICRILADYYTRRPDGAGLANFYRARAEARANVP